jgi:hypothetical protein
VHDEEHLVHHVLRHRVGDAHAPHDSPHQIGVLLVDDGEVGRMVAVSRGVGVGLGRRHPHRPL